MNLAYDLGRCPASWDFLQWLINADIARWEMGYKQLGVCFIPGPKDGFRDDTGERPISARAEIFRNVMKPALALVNAKRVESGLSDKEFPNPYMVRNCVEYHNRGGTVPNFRIPEASMDEAAAYLDGRKPLVITLREASYCPARNSNLAAWTAFAKNCGEDVIFVRDTAKADEPLNGFEICPRASKELLFRAALMAYAKCNLSVANGPWILSLYSGVPWLMFGAWRPDLPNYKPGSARWQAVQQGVPIGSQFPWSMPSQRVVWQRDGLEAITQAWEEMSSTLKRRHRRRVSRELKQYFKFIRERTAKYGDELLRIDTIKMYEGVDDEPADCLIALDILEHLSDPGAAIEEMNRLARKSIVINVRPDAIRPEEWWKKLVNRYLTVNDWQFHEGMLSAYCNAGMKIKGLTIQGALSKDDRWSHIEQSIVKINKRVEKVPAHDGKCVIACYGPSLTDYLPKLRHEMQARGARLISVSGAHDFLLKNNLVPDYHVECDPRPHKTDNIKLPDKRINYLIASVCHPSLFERLKDCEVRLWHVSEGESNMRLIDERGEKVETMISGGGSVGLRSITLMYLLGYRDFSIFGMDCSFKDERSAEERFKDMKEKNYEDTPDKIAQWAGSHAGKRQQIDYCQCGDRIFTTSPVLVAYASHFFDIMKRLPDATFEVWGDGLLPAMCRAYWKHPQLKQSEVREVDNAA